MFSLCIYCFRTDFSELDSQQESSSLEEAKSHSPSSQQLPLALCLWVGSSESSLLSDYYVYAYCQCFWLVLQPFLGETVSQLDWYLPTTVFLASLLGFLEAWMQEM